MALNGRVRKNVGEHWRLSVEWTGDQSISGNYTDVTLKMYWEATDSYGAVYSSASKTGGIEAGGGETAKAWDTFTASAALNGNQKKLIRTWSRRINHNDEGKASLSVDGYFNAEVTLAGTWYASINLDEESFPLDTIPRKSTMSSSASFTAGSDRTITVREASSSFTHKVYIDVQDSGGAWANVKSIDFGGTSVNTSFSTAEHTQIFQAINGRSSAPIRMNLYTYDRNGNSLGYNQYTGSATAPSASSFTGSFDDYVYVDQDMSGNISRANSSFLHTVTVKLGSFTKSWTNLTTSWSWSPTATESLQLAQRFPSKLKESGTIEITTYYNGVKVRGTVSRTYSFTVRNAEPTFSASSVTYKDINATTVAITGSDQSIIQGVSKLRVTIGAGVSTKWGATFSKFIVRVSGKDGTLTATTGNVDLAEITSASNTTIFVDAIDSRGLKTTVSVNMNLIQYQAPLIGGKAIRQNGFETATSLQPNGLFDVLTVNGVNKNIIQSVQYRYKERKGSTWSSWVSMTFTTNSGKINVTPKIQDLLNTKAWNVEFKIVDKLSTVVLPLVVEEGQPILFIHPDLRSLGFNDFPVNPNEFRVNGRIVFGANMWATNSTGEGGFGVMDLQNSDVTGANGIYFYDIANNSGEGLMFPKSGTTPGSTDRANYDQFRVLDGTGYLGSKPIFTSDNEVLWEGHVFLRDDHNVVPSKRLSQCPNGWILFWSHYDGGPYNYDWNFTVIHKRFGNLTSGGFHATMMTRHEGLTSKYVYASDTTLTGLASNGTGARGTQAMRYVLSF